MLEGEDWRLQDLHAQAVRGDEEGTTYIVFSSFVRRGRFKAGPSARHSGLAGMNVKHCAKPIYFYLVGPRSGPLVCLLVYWLYCNSLVRQHRQAHTRLQVELVLDKF